MIAGRGMAEEILRIIRPRTIKIEEKLNGKEYRIHRHQQRIEGNMMYSLNHFEPWET